MAANLDTSLESKMLKTESTEDCDNAEPLPDKISSPLATTKKKKTFLSSLKSTPLFSSSPLVSIATNIKNSLHPSRDPLPSNTGGQNLHKSSRSSFNQELFPAGSPLSPVLLRRKSSTRSPTHSFKMSSTLFDPEEEEPIGPLFGVLRMTQSGEEMSNIESDISSVASVTSSKAPKGFLDRIKSSFGSRLSFGSSTSRSTFTDSAMWWSKVGARSLRESSSVDTPEMPRRRNSISAFFKRSCSSSSVKCDQGKGERRNTLAEYFKSSNLIQTNERKKYDITDDIPKNKNSSKSLEIARLGPTLRPISIKADVDYREMGLKSLEDQNPQASLSWVWQEMGEKNKNEVGVELQTGRTSNDSGDSGIVRSTSKDTRYHSGMSKDVKYENKMSKNSDYEKGMAKDANCTSPEQVFGSIPELDDEVFLDMFKTEHKVSSFNSTAHDDSGMNGSVKKEITKSILENDSVLQGQEDFDQMLNSIPMLVDVSSVRRGVNKEFNKLSPAEDQIDNKKREKIPIRTNPRAFRTPAGTNGTNSGLDEKGDGEKRGIVRNSIRTNPNIHWTPAKSIKKEQVTSI